MGGLSLKFKIKVRSAEVLNVNERATMSLLCCLYTYKARLQARLQSLVITLCICISTKPVFFCFHEVLEVTFKSRILTVISLLGFYFEIANSNKALI